MSELANEEVRIVGISGSLRRWAGPHLARAFTGGWTGGKLRPEEALKPLLTAPGEQL